MAQEDQSEKTEEPTHKKLQDAREKGQVPKSREFNTALILMAGALIALSLGPALGREIMRVLATFIEQPHEIATDLDNLRLVLIDAVLSLGWVLGLGALGLVVAAASAGLIQHGPVWSGESLKPKISKISLTKGLKRQFSLKALVEFAKGILKLAVVAAVALMVLLPDLDTLPLLIDQEPGQTLRVLFVLSLKMVAGVIAAITVIAGLDLMYQRYEFTKQQRMSRREVRDEHKQTEGDPMVKARLRSIRMEKARRRMMAAVPEAAVVVTNPTHYAVALKYDEIEMEAPTLVAKGTDLVAQRIRVLAEENDVPIVENPPLARALHAGELGQMIPVETYRAVAEVISYIWRLRGYKRRDTPDAGAQTRRRGRARRRRSARPVSGHGERA
jgi:flagellar biosynthetic protein FlhB